MINVFTVAINDQSLYYLGRIFGNVGDVLPGTGPAILSAMFKVFNTAMLAVGALIVTYTTVVGVLNTAAEGEFLGKQWHSLWVPIRTVIGIAGLFPMKSGYCAIQVIIMWVIIQGIGAADTVWNAAINYFQKGGAISVPAPSNVITSGMTTGMQTLFKNLTCDAAFRVFWCTPSNKSPICAQGGIGSRMVCDNGNNCKLVMGPNGECGTLNWNKSNAVGMAQDSAYRSIVPTLYQISNYFARAYKLQDEYLNDKQANPGPGFPPKDAKGNKPATYNGQQYWNLVLNPYVGTNFIRDAVNAYLGYVNNAKSATGTGATFGQVIGAAGGAGIAGAAVAGPVGAVAGAVAGFATAIKGMLIDLNKTYETAKANGWIFAGGYFYFIASTTNTVTRDDITSVTMNFSAFVPPTTKSTEQVIREYFQGEGVYRPDTPPVDLANAAQDITKAIAAAQSTGGGEGEQAAAGRVASSGSWVTDLILTVFTANLAPALVGGFINMLSGTGDVQSNPIVNLQSFGETLLVVMQILFVALFALIFVTTLSTAVGSSMSSLGYAVTNVASYILPIVMALLFSLFVFGATLAVYVPLIPYIIFTMGAIGWFMSTIEAMVAGPIVALGIIHPEGQHQIWGKAEHGVLLLMNIFLRPTLMIFGLISGMLLSYVIVTLVNAAFVNVMRQIYSGPGLVETILFIAAYIGLIITALNKCFSLIHLLPEKVLGWIGGRGEAYGEGEAAKEVRGQVGSAAGGISSGAVSGGKMTGKIQKEMAAQKGAVQAEEEPPASSSNASDEADKLK